MEIFYFIFQKSIKLTSAAGVTVMVQCKRTNVNLTTEMGQIDEFAMF